MRLCFILFKKFKKKNFVSCCVVSYQLDSLFLGNNHLSFDFTQLLTSGNGSGKEGNRKSSQIMLRITKSQCWKELTELLRIEDSIIQLEA